MVLEEIILLGQNVNAYNFSSNNKQYKLSSLINELNRIDNLKRIRFTTSHPKDMTEDLIACYDKIVKNLCHFYTFLFRVDQIKFLNQ